MQPGPPPPSIRNPICRPCLIQFGADHFGDAALWLDRKGDILYANRAACELLGYSQKELLFLRLSDLVPQLQDDWAASAQEQPGATEAETLCRTREGSLFPTELRASHTVLDSRAFLCVFLRDISERKRLEEQVREAHKMEALGRLVGGVFHDFNNLLTAVLIHSGLLEEQLHSNSRLRHHVEHIHTAAERGSALVNQLLAFSRQQPAAPRRLSLGALLDAMKEMLEHLVGEDIEVAIHCPGDLDWIHADPAQMEQVIVNLAANARDAMPSGGRLTIEARNFTAEERYARRHLGVTPGPWVRLTVSDTGGGMDAEIRAHAFEPFFTTKERGQGSGLGLSVVYGAVKQSGGHIELESRLGRGTTVRILLARAQPEAAAGPAVPQAQEQPAQPGSETVLLVEDEDLLRQSLHEALTRKGYRVLQARRGPEAMLIGQQYDGPIDLMVTDVVMPGMSGKELAEHLRPVRPEMRVLYISGYREDQRVRELTSAGQPFFPKPFTAAALTRKLREVLRPGQRLQLMTKNK